jgi:hypothetical protein
MNTVQKHNNSCQLCGKTSRHSKNEQMICTDCTDLIKQLQQDKGKLVAFCQLLGIPEAVQQKEPQIEQELPDVLDAVRYRTTDRERNRWYVSVSELDKNPVEIFASTAFDRDQHLQSRISNLTTITRLISLILRNIYLGERLTLEKTLTQLRRSSRQTNDLPDMLCTVLANYRREKPATPEQEQQRTGS